MAKIPASTKDEEVGPLAESFVRLAKELQKVSQDPSLAADLARTKIGSEIARQRFHTNANVLRKRLAANARKQILEGWQACAKLEESMSSQPSCKKEAEYIKAVVPLVKHLAEEAGKLDACCQRLKSMLPPIKKLAEAVFVEGEAGADCVEVSFKDAGESEEDFFARCEPCFVLCKTHVALAAMLCVLRNKALGSVTAEGKELAAKLQSIVPTLRKHLDALSTHAHASAGKTTTPGLYRQNNGYKTRVFAEIIVVEAGEFLSPQKAEAEPKASGQGKEKGKDRKEKDDKGEKKRKASKVPLEEPEDETQAEEMDRRKRKEKAAEKDKKGKKEPPKEAKAEEAGAKKGKKSK